MLEKHFGALQLHFKSPETCEESAGVKRAGKKDNCWFAGALGETVNHGAIVYAMPKRRGDLQLL